MHTTISETLCPGPVLEFYEEDFMVLIFESRKHACACEGSTVFSISWRISIKKFHFEWSKGTIPSLKTGYDCVSFIQPSFSPRRLLAFPQAPSLKMCNFLNDSAAGCIACIEPWIYIDKSTRSMSMCYILDYYTRIRVFVYITYHSLISRDRNNRVLITCERKHIIMALMRICT